MLARFNSDHDVGGNDQRIVHEFALS